MKLLLDECVVQDFRHHLPGYDVFTAGYQGWSGIANGRLLALAEAEGFDVLITTDHGYAAQHNLATLPVAVVILHDRSNDLDDLVPLAPALLDTLERMVPRSVTIVRHE